MISTKDRNKIMVFFGLIGLVTPLLLSKVVMPILDFLGSILPQVQLKLAETTPVISIAVRESLTGIEGGLSGWLVDALGLTVSIPFRTYVMSVIGAILLGLLGAYVADSFGWLTGDAVKKTRIVIFLGSLGAGLILGIVVIEGLGITLINTLIAFAVNAAILSYIYIWLDKKLNLKLIPF